MNWIARLGARALDVMRGWGRAALFFSDLLVALPPALRCWLRSSACCTSRRSTERSTGLVTKSKAPALSAFTAASTLP